MIWRIVLSLSFLLPVITHAQPNVETLFKINQQYSVCSDVAQSNFDTEQEAFVAVGIFTRAIIKNLNIILDDMLQNDEMDGTMNRFIEITGSRDIVIGHMLKSVADNNTEFNAEKNELKKALNYDWREVHAKLWSKYGCDAIYENLVGKN